MGRVARRLPDAEALRAFSSATLARIENVAHCVAEQVGSEHGQ
jgi:hypothetical protein